MKIYLPQHKDERHTVHIAPGKDIDTPEFRNPDGTFTLFTVTFDGGVAEVPDSLGKYMVDKGYARRSPNFLRRASAHLAEAFA